MKRERLKHLDFILGDLAALMLANYLGVAFRFHRIMTPGLRDTYYRLGILLAAITLSVIFFSDEYSGILDRGYLKEFWKVCRHMAFVFALEIVCLFSFHIEDVYSRAALFMTLFLGILFMYLSRISIKHYLRWRFSKIKYARNLMLISTLEQSRILAGKMQSSSISAFKLDGVVIVDQDLKGERLWEGGPEIKSNLEELLNCVSGDVIDEVIISIPGDPEEEARLATMFMDIGVVVHIYVEQRFERFPNREYGKVSGINVLTCKSRTVPGWELFVKLIMDVLGGVVGTILTVFVGLVIGPLIYIASPGPIFFKQIRIGKNGRKFKLYKFRSMYPDAEARKKELAAKNEMKGFMFKMEDDPRIIKGIGQFIRKTSLDEFPQFLNVLKRDMSLVGTRPPTVDEYEKYEFHHKKRLSMKPGITGLWQVSGRNKITDFEEIVKLDSRYIDSWSLELDIKILLKTVLELFRRNGV